MFRNHEGYADPTFGAVYAKIRHEEKLAKKRLKANADKVSGNNSLAGKKDMKPRRRPRVQVWRAESGPDSDRKEKSQ